MKPPKTIKTSKTIKNLKVFVLGIVIGMIVAPSASSHVYFQINPHTGALSTATEEVYKVGPYTGDTPNTEDSYSTRGHSIAKDFSTEESDFALLGAANIAQGKTVIYKANVGSGVKWLEVDLDWGDESDSLTLSIYTPSGKGIGTYIDKADGSLNARIHVSVKPDNVYVASGTWMFKMYGESVEGQEDYKLRVAHH